MAAARQERLEESRRLLRETECPDHPAVLRELAGVTLRLGDAGAAIDLARRAARRDPDDAHVARTLATALYVADRPEEALAEWNRADEPVVDLVRIGGLDRVRYGPAARAIGLSGGQLLTPRGLAMARRRLDDLPASATTRVSYAPTGGGRADIVAGVAERRGFVLDPFTLGILGTRALIYREVGATAVSPLGAGETWTGTWRWWRHRPGVAFRFATPSEFGPRSTWTVAAAWERETYALEPVAGTPDAPAEDDRAGGHLEVGGWIDPAVRIAGRIGYDRWETAGGRVRLGGTTEVRAAGDRLRLSVDGDVWVGGDGPAFRVAGARADATTNTAPNGLVGRARGYVRSAAREAPLTLWPGAGGGVARPDLLRAHRLLDGGILAGDVFDRHLAGGGIEIVRWFSIGPGARLGPAAFVDLARAWGSRTAASRADAGAGLRLTGPGGGAELRLDVAFGLSDDEWAISAGWSSPR